LNGPSTAGTSYDITAFISPSPLAFSVTQGGYIQAYSYYWMADQNKWTGTSYFNGDQHSLSWDGKTLTGDMLVLDKNHTRTSSPSRPSRAA
jgi:hypothetical protein